MVSSLITKSVYSKHTWGSPTTSLVHISHMFAQLKLLPVCRYQINHEMVRVTQCSARDRVLRTTDCVTVIWSIPLTGWTFYGAYIWEVSWLGLPFLCLSFFLSSSVPKNSNYGVLLVTGELQPNSCSPDYGIDRYSNNWRLSTLVQSKHKFAIISLVVDCGDG